MDDSLDSFTVWITSASLILVTIIPLNAFWSIHLRSTPIAQPSQPVRFARVYMSLALPIWIIAVTLAPISPLIAAKARRNGSGPQPFGSATRDAELASMYTVLISSFLTTTAAVFTTVAVYLTGICALYVALSRQKWWKALRLDAICGSVLFVALATAWFGKTLADDINVRSSTRWYGFRFEWLLIIVDIALALLAAGVVGVAIYVVVRFRSRSHYEVGNLSSHLLAASLLWLLRCAFVLTVDLQNIIPIWTAVGLSAQKIVYPILDFWVSTAVMGLITDILRKSLWSDPTIIPDPGSWVQDGFVQEEMHYSQQPYRPQRSGE